MLQYFGLIGVLLCDRLTILIAQLDSVVVAKPALSLI